MHIQYTYKRIEIRESHLREFLVSFAFDDIDIMCKAFDNSKFEIGKTIKLLNTFLFKTLMQHAGIKPNYFYHATVLKGDTVLMYACCVCLCL